MTRLRPVGWQRPQLATSKALALLQHAFAQGAGGLVRLRRMNLHCEMSRADGSVALVPCAIVSLWRRHGWVEYVIEPERQGLTLTEVGREAMRRVAA